MPQFLITKVTEILRTGEILIEIIAICSYTDIIMLTDRVFNKRVQVLMDSNQRRMLAHGGKFLRCISRKTLSQETEVFVYLFVILNGADNWIQGLPHIRGIFYQ